MKAFLYETEAWEFIRSISDTKVRLLTQVSLSIAISFLISDQHYKETVAARPMDILALAKALNSIFQSQDILQAILDGAVQNIEELDPLREPTWSSRKPVER